MVHRFACFEVREVPGSVCVQELTHGHGEAHGDLERCVIKGCQLWASSLNLLSRRSGAAATTLLALTALPPVLTDAAATTLLAPTATPPVLALTFGSLRCWWLLEDTRHRLA